MSDPTPRPAPFAPPGSDVLAEPSAGRDLLADPGAASQLGAQYQPGRTEHRPAPPLAGPPLAGAAPTRAESSPSRRLWVAAAGIAAVAAISAAGALLFLGNTSGAVRVSPEASKPPLQIFKDAQAATASASSVHVSGRTGSGQIDIVVSNTIGGGTISYNGLTLNIVSDHDSTYIKADAATWQQVIHVPGAGATLDNRWIRISTADPDVRELASLVNLESLTQTLSPQGAVRKGSLTVIRGTQAIPLTDATGGVLYVAAAGTPRILEITQPAPSRDAGTVVFDGYDTAPLPAVPTGAIDAGSAGAQA